MRTVIPTFAGISVAKNLRVIGEFWKFRKVNWSSQLPKDLH